MFDVLLWENNSLEIARSNLRHQGALCVLYNALLSGSSPGVAESVRGRRRREMFQGTGVERKDLRDARDRFASAIARPKTRHARQPNWRFPRKKTVVLWLLDPGFPAPTDVHGIVVVEDLRSTLCTALRQGYTVAVDPVTATMGTCAIIQDASGRRLCLLEPPQASLSAGVPGEAVISLVKGEKE